jgi:hypothetical protein
MTATPFNQKTIDEFHDKAERGVGSWGDHLLLMRVLTPYLGTGFRLSP